MMLKLFNIKSTIMCIALTIMGNSYADAFPRSANFFEVTPETIKEMRERLNILPKQDCTEQVQQVEADLAIQCDDLTIPIIDRLKREGEEKISIQNQKEQQKTQLIHRTHAGFEAYMRHMTQEQFKKETSDTIARRSLWAGFGFSLYHFSHSIIANITSMQGAALLHTGCHVTLFGLGASCAFVPLLGAASMLYFGMKSTYVKNSMDTDMININNGYISQYRDTLMSQWESSLN